MNDRIFGFITLGVSVFYFWAASITELSFISDPVGPKKFPYIVAFFLAVSSLVLIFKPDAKPQWPEIRKIIEIIITAAILIIYATILPDLGFTISTTLMATFLAWRLGATVLKAFIAGAIISVTIFVLFRLVLGLSLAIGPLGF